MKSQKKIKGTLSNNANNNRDVVTQATGEINKIFDAIAKKKAASNIHSIKKGDKSKISKKKRNKAFGEVTDKGLIVKNNNVKPLRYLNDGLPVYRLEDINVGKCNIMYIRDDLLLDR